MKTSNKKILIVTVIIAVIVCTVMLLLKPDLTNDTSGNIQSQQEIPNTENTEEDPTKNDENINGLEQPIFMYFVTNADLNDKTTKETLEKLQNEYKDRVIFEIRNADEDPTLYDNFPLDAGMPMLIMQKKGGDIANFLFSNNKYDELKAAIEATL